MAVILSHGKNGLWAISEGGIALAAPASAAEIQNAGNNTAFVRTEYSENAVNYFDDIVAAFSPDDLPSPLTRDGAINSARSITHADMIRKILCGSATRLRFSDDVELPTSLCVSL